jgi:hypothetical protein
MNRLLKTLTREIVIPGTDSGGEEPLVIRVRRLPPDVAMSVAQDLDRLQKAQADPTNPDRIREDSEELRRVYARVAKLGVVSVGNSSESYTFVYDGDEGGDLGAVRFHDLMIGTQIEVYRTVLNMSMEGVPAAVEAAAAFRPQGEAGERGVQDGSAGVGPGGDGDVGESAAPPDGLPGVATTGGADVQQAGVAVGEAV